MDTVLDVEGSITIGEFATFVLWKEPKSKITLGKTDDIFVFKDKRDEYEYSVRYVQSNELLSNIVFGEAVCNCNRALVVCDTPTWRYQPAIPIKNNEDRHALKNWFVDISFPNELQNKPPIPFEGIPCNWNLADAFFQWLLNLRIASNFEKTSKTTESETETDGL